MLYTLNPIQNDETYPGCVPATDPYPPVAGPMDTPEGCPKPPPLPDVPGTPWGAKGSPKDDILKVSAIEPRLYCSVKVELGYISSPPQHQVLPLSSMIMTLFLTHTTYWASRGMWGGWNTACLLPDVYRFRSTH